MYSDFDDLCEGDSLFFPSDGICTPSGTTDNFMFSCTSGFTIGDCEYEFSLNGNGQLVGDTFNGGFTLTQTLAGTTCSGSCTTTFTSAFTRTGDAVCTGKAPERVYLFRMPEVLAR